MSEQSEAFYQSEPQGESAAQLWKIYGQHMPFSQWVDNEVVKAKTSGFYKKDMTFREIFDANRETPAPVIKKESEPVKKFTIAGMNGYAVIAGILVIAGVIYFGNKKMKA